MNNKLIILFLCIFSSSYGQDLVFMPYASSGTPPTPSTGAESIWLFENNYTDTKGNHTLTPQGSPVFAALPTPPQGSYAIDLNSSGRYLELESIAYGNSFTWIFEVYTGTGSKTLVGAMPSNDGFRFSIDATNDDIYFYTGNGTDINHANAMNCGLAAYSFMQIAVTVNRTAGTAQIYLNGSDVTTDNTIRTDFETTTTALLGSIQSIGSYLYGNLDAVQLYLWELTPTQISNANTTPGQEQTQ